MYKYILFFLLLSTNSFGQKKIDRKTVVSRHTVQISEVDTLNPLTLGNGKFAMTMDVTGLQTFPIKYSKGIPLGTMSEWGWHSFPTDKKYDINETLQSINSHGRQVPYARQWPSEVSAGKASNYIRQNPHRIHLANVGWYILKSDGSKINISDVKNIRQKLDLWNGELISIFEIEGIPVKVVSLIGLKNDVLGVKIKSQLVKEGRIGLTIKYPYPTDTFLDEAVNYDSNESLRLKLRPTNHKNLVIERNLDSTNYTTLLSSSLNLNSEPEYQEGFNIFPNEQKDTWSFSLNFSNDTKNLKQVKFNEFRKQAKSSFHSFWDSVGMIDFGETKDPRAFELERRMILSLYLTKINCGGSSPPQETGLTYNSWYGKPHIEMSWWHGVHFAQWNQPEVLKKQTNWFFRSKTTAKTIAKRQGFKGVRWQKMTDNNGGETTSSIGSYLIWQQPHFIYFSELLYKLSEEKNLLQEYYPLVEKTAEFMADFAWYDPNLKRYVLGPGVIPAQERFDPEITFNPTFELAYWRWGLNTAQEWRTRMGMERNKKWDKVLSGLSPLPAQDGLYLATESSPNSYSEVKFMTDHPSVLGAYGILPRTDGLDKKIMQNTFDKILTDWKWEETWGWDFPMTAMTAIRLGSPNKAIDALLMPITTNTFLKNGHNYQNKTLRIYLPGNGGFLTALGMMAVGTYETKEAVSSFPKNWKIKIENIRKIH
ncbi:hypothetical protein GGR42_001534 [Saonia flava]|uniref:Uncharacterized protein n=1 Tax=Saonia flava TaxID=523696 RepID=A0A846QWV7_9FLAO|nr:hypothetical protein [Saonia flava]NJB71072.1 hypothetical protein [Saonia flava]